MKQEGILRRATSISMLPAWVLLLSVLVGWWLAKGDTLPLAALGLLALVLTASADLILPVILWLLVAPFLQAGLESGSSLVWFSYAIHRALLPVLAIIAILRQSLQKSARFALPEKFFIAFLLYALISSLLTWGTNFNSDPAQNALRILVFTYAVPLTAFLLANRLELTERRRKALLITLSVMSVAVSGAALFEYAMGIQIFPGTIRWQEFWGARAVGPLGQPVITGYVVQVGLLAALYLAVRLKSLGYRFLGIAGVLLTGLYTLVTYTRSVWLSFLVALGTVAFIHRPVRRWVLVAFVLVLALLFANIGGLINLDFLQQRASDQYNLLGRLAISYTSLQMFLDQPLFGQGFGSYDQRLSEFAVPFLDLPAEVVESSTSHDTFLTILAELGLIGFVLYAAAIVTALLPALKILTNRSPGQPMDRLLLVTLLGGVLAYVVNALFIDMRFFSFAQSLFWFNLGLCYSVASRKHETDDAEGEAV